MSSSASQRASTLTLHQGFFSRSLLGDTLFVSYPWETQRVRG
jgi:hypothetical protein